MSVYRPKGTPFYHFDFEWRGNRFHGSTKRTNRREAESVEQRERARAKQEQKAVASAHDSLQLDHVAARYWKEAGQHHKGADNTWRDLERVVDYFGPTTALNEITDAKVAEFIAWRRGHVTGSKGAKRLISSATVNRSATEMLKKLFTRARTAWRFKFEAEPNWKAHMLAEPSERVRELQSAELDALETEMRGDYAPVLAFALTSGLRKSECLLKWSQVNFATRRITRAGKGGKVISAPVTPSMLEILAPLRGHHLEAVFTYVAKRTIRGRVKGQRYPVTVSGLNTVWKRWRLAAGIKDLRIHDLRHDFASKLLRECGNLKIVQRALGHADIKTTVRYAHVLDDEVADAIERASESRKKSRTERAKVA